MRRLRALVVLAIVVLAAVGFMRTGRRGGPGVGGYKVVGVTDGDTITVISPGGRSYKRTRIRLWGVDCPEKSQAFGQRAKQFTSDLVYGKEVSLDERDVDRYGRTVAVVRVDGKVLNEELVKAGYAWWYERYAPGEARLRDLQAEARSARRGLWVDANAEPPWDYRREKRR